MRRLVLIAGRPSHGPGAHEHRAGMRLLARCLAAHPDLDVRVHEGGWVSDPSDLADADAVAIFADGGPSHPLLVEDRLATIDWLVRERRLGVGLMHYAVEVPDEVAPVTDEWVGGHYRTGVSCNPIWEARVWQLADHPISRGVRAFAVTDEWYFNLVFRGQAPGTAADAGVTPILVATPSDAVRAGPYVYPAGPYPHIVADAGRAETLMWAYTRRDGGRGLGFNGGHFHSNWGHAPFRTAVLNGLTWLAGAEVPRDGVPSTVTEDDLARDLDAKP